MNSGERSPDRYVRQPAHDGGGALLVLAEGFTIDTLTEPLGVRT
jgi:hypothetical protein